MSEEGGVIRILKNTASTLVNVILWIVLFGSVFFIGITSSQVTYDPLLDVTGDGYGGIDDIVAVAEHFGASGTPINWTQVLESITALEDRVSDLEGESHLHLQIISESYNAVTDGADGTVTVPFPGSSFTSAPDIVHCNVVLRAAAAGMPKGALAYPNVSGITSSQFDVEVVEHNGSSTTINGYDVTIIYIAIDIIYS